MRIAGVTSAAPPLVSVPTLAPEPSAPSLQLSAANPVWTVDTQRAAADAAAAFAAIDWSKRDIVIWLPGTSSHVVNPGFARAVATAWGNSGVSLSMLDYEASWQLDRSVATGVESLKILLAAIAARKGAHRVLVAGESQGAWIIGEAMADPAMMRVVDRAVLMGHPALAGHHYDGDQKVIEINHRRDLVTMPLKGNADHAFDAMRAVHLLDPRYIGSLVRASLANPAQLGLMALGAVRWLLSDGLVPDPHDYTGDMARAAALLREDTDSA